MKKNMEFLLLIIIIIFTATTMFVLMSFIGKADIQPPFYFEKGDILFCESRNPTYWIPGWDHTSIYIGNDKFIEAIPGEGVQITNFSKYHKWATNFIYGFVRTADDLVDTPYPDEAQFYRFKHKYELAKSGTKTGDVVIDSFAELEQRRKFDPKWTKAFLNSMEMDLTKKTYDTLDDVLDYVYGAAEVMGLYSRPGRKQSEEV